jgi:hypothetical protein
MTTPKSATLKARLNLKGVSDQKLLAEMASLEKLIEQRAAKLQAKINKQADLDNPKESRTTENSKKINLGAHLLKLVKDGDAQAKTMFDRIVADLDKTLKQNSTRVALGLKPIPKATKTPTPAPVTDGTPPTVKSEAESIMDKVKRAW